MTDGGGGTTGASSLSFFGSDSTVSLHGALDDDGSAYLFGDWERTTITGSAATTTRGGVCSFCGWSESFLYWDALRNLIFTLRNSLVSTSTASSSGFGNFDFLLKINHFFFKLKQYSIKFKLKMSSYANNFIWFK
jgi:hypothetical protein